MATRRTVKSLDEATPPTGEERKRMEAEADAADATFAKKAAEKKATPKKAGPTDAEKADKEKAAAAAKVEKDKAAAKAKAEKEALQAKGEKQLVPVAKEITARLDSAAKNEQKADDMRLSAAQFLAQAEVICKETGVQFKAWAEKNVPQSYETVRKLLAVGKAPDPVLALADMRAANAKANAKSRANKKETTKPSVPSETGPARPSPNKSNTDWTRAEETMLALPDTGKASLAEAAASKVGLRVVPEQQFKNWTAADKLEPVARAKAAFRDLTAKGKQEFLNWACAELGGSFKSDFGE